MSSTPRPDVRFGPCASPANPMSHRIAQIESLLKRAISKVLVTKLADPRIEGLISVTKVTVSPDLHDAYVHVSVLPEKHQARTLYGLRHAAVHIHALVCKEVALRTVPHLEFRLDESLKKQAAVLSAIRRGIEREQQASGEPAGPDSEPTQGPDAAPEDTRQ